MNWTKTYKKAITFSYDDGVTTDLKLLEIFNKYGMKCTFNLNYGLGPTSGGWECNGKPVNRLNLAENVAAYAAMRAPSDNHCESIVRYTLPS